MSLAEHHDKTWYKNSQKFRNQSRTWKSEVAFNREPQLVAEVLLDERVWGIPSATSDDIVIFGCYDSAVHALDIHKLEEVWRFQTDGPVYSSTTVVSSGGCVVGCEDFRLRRLGNTGNLLWVFGSGGKFHQTPTVDENRDAVYIGSYDHNMYCVSLSTGKRRWAIDYSRVIAGESRRFPALASSPALTRDGEIIFGANTELTCVRPDGSVLWTTFLDSQIASTAALDLDLNRGIIGTKSGSIYLFDIGTGVIVQSIKSGGAVDSCPAIGLGGLAFIASNDEKLYAISLERGDVRWVAPAGGQAWYTQLTIAPTGEVMLSASDERLHCFDPENGRELWTVGHARGIHSSPLITATGSLFVGSHRNAVFKYQWPYRNGASDTMDLPG
ncbi:PQQ-binding-like beta-propeller repeat protein [Agrobacterium tumefaciens]|uniref:outer membrane protein assembly factor BamB family protein n=1 Tax=Agrobacterium tumefaciens TaxID=358 RepID=UPI000AEFDA52